MGYTCNNPKDLKDAILRRMGAPVINVEVTEGQIYDCIQRAIELYGDYHYDGVNKSYMTVVLTEEQAASGVIQLPNPGSVFAVTRMLRYQTGCLGTFGGTTYSWFTDFINGLAGSPGAVSSYGPMGGLGGMSYYTQLMGYMNMVQDILNPLRDYWYNSTNGQLKVFGNLKPGEALIFEVYIKSYVDLDMSYAYAGSHGFTAGAAGVCGSSDISHGDIYDDPYRQMTNKYRAGADSNIPLDQQVYNVRWVKDYSAALVKELNGQILARHQGMQLPGGITVDGIRLIEEAKIEIENLREELYSLEEPLGIIMG